MIASGGLTADELIGSLRRRHAALPSEIGTFVIFEACEAALRNVPVVLSGAHVWIDTDGRVSVLPGAGPARDEQSARSLHALLTTVLLASRPGLSPALLRLVEEGPSEGRWSLAAMRDDLEAALVPLNRLASRRVLARLLREAAADRMRRDPTEEAPLTYAELDAELGDLLGEPASASAPGSPRGDEPTLREPVEELGELDAQVEPNDSIDAVTGRMARTAVTQISEPPAQALARSRPSASRRGSVRRPQADVVTDRFDNLFTASLQEIGESQRPVARRGLWLGAALVALAVLLVASVAILRPDIASRLAGEPPPPPPIDLPIVQSGPRAGDLVLEVSPERSQVLLYVGTAPVEVENVPVGVAQEFVALSAGGAPTRALIAADDTWEQGEQGPYYELAMQTGRGADDSGDLGSSLLPAEPGSARSSDGRVRVITTPRGAKVYRVVGFAPEANLGNLNVDRELELLIHCDGYEPQTLRVGPDDWPVAGARAQLREVVSLERKPRRKK